MSKLLLLLSLLVVDCGWNNQSILIAQTESEAKASPSATASAASEDENKSQVLKTSPSGAFRVVQNGEDFWILTAADENQRTKMHSAELVIPEEFRFSPDEKWLYVELHHGFADGKTFQRSRRLGDDGWIELVHLLVAVERRRFDDIARRIDRVIL